MTGDEIGGSYGYGGLGLSGSGEGGGAVGYGMGIGTLGASTKSSSAPMAQPMAMEKSMDYEMSEAEDDMDGLVGGAAYGLSLGSGQAVATGPKVRVVIRTNFAFSRNCLILEQPR